MADYPAKTESSKCIFCEIGSGNIPPLGNAIIYEDDHFLGFLAPFPNTEGFAVVMPKQHQSSDVLQLSNDILHPFLDVAKKVGDLLTNYFDDVGRVGVLMEGLGIDHAHIKLFPMHGTGSLKRGEWQQFTCDNDDFYESYPGFISSNDGPKADFDKLQELAKAIRNKSI